MEQKTLSTEVRKVTIMTVLDSWACYQSLRFIHLGSSACCWLKQRTLFILVKRKEDSLNGSSKGMKQPICSISLFTSGPGSFIVRNRREMEHRETIQLSPLALSLFSHLQSILLFLAERKLGAGASLLVLCLVVKEDKKQRCTQFSLCFIVVLRALLYHITWLADSCWAGTFHHK